MFWVGPDGRAVVNGSGDERSRTLGIPPYAGAKGEVTFQQPDVRIGYIALSGDMKTAVTGGETNGALRIWDGETGRSTGAVMGHAVGLARVAMSGNGQTIASVDTHWRVKVWRTATCVQPTVAGRTETVKVAAARRERTAPDGSPVSEKERVIAVSGDGKKTMAYKPAGPNGAYVYGIVNAADGNVMATLEGAEEIGEGRKYDFYDGAAFSPDGRYVAAFVSDTSEMHKAEPGPYKTLRVWDAADGMGSPSFATGATGMGWSPDGRRIATVSRDGQVAIWDPPMGLELMRLTGLPGFAATSRVQHGRKAGRGSGTSSRRESRRMGCGGRTEGAGSGVGAGHAASGAVGTAEPRPSPCPLPRERDDWRVDTTRPTCSSLSSTTPVSFHDMASPRP